MIQPNFFLVTFHTKATIPNKMSNPSKKNPVVDERTNEKKRERKRWQCKHHQWYSVLVSVYWLDRPVCVIWLCYGASNTISNWFQSSLTINWWESGKVEHIWRRPCTCMMWEIDLVCFYHENRGKTKINSIKSEIETQVNDDKPTQCWLDGWLTGCLVRHSKDIHTYSCVIVLHSVIKSYRIVRDVK